MDTICIPDSLPATVTRPRPLIAAVMSQSLREQGADSRTAAAWRWVLTGTGPSPVSLSSMAGAPPASDDITIEARYDTDPPECGWPPWRYAYDPNPDRQQARRVLRWLTGAADAIPLLDPARGRFVGARFHFARTDDDLRRVRGWALHGLREHGDLPEDIPLREAERPWQWPSWWMNAAWLRGTISYLDWVLDNTPITPLTRRRKPLSQAYGSDSSDPRVISALCSTFGVGTGRRDIEEEITVHASGVFMQGREGQPRAEPNKWPPPQWGEAVDQAHKWATGEDDKPPADHHGCGDYYPCPGERRCSCEAAGYCLRGQCPACADRICNAAWAAIEENYQI